MAADVRGIGSWFISPRTVTAVPSPPQSLYRPRSHCRRTFANAFRSSPLPQAAAPASSLHNYSMTKQSRQRKDVKQTLDAADDLFQCISSLSAQFSSFGMSAQADRLWAQVHISKSASDQARLYRDLIGTTQTDVVQNDNDPYGDGDQRRLPSESQCQVFRNIWTVGGDLEHLFSPDPTSPSGRGFSPLCFGLRHWK